MYKPMPMHEFHEAKNLRRVVRITDDCWVKLKASGVSFSYEPGHEMDEETEAEFKSLLDVLTPEEKEELRYLYKL